jgi:long-chain acyl-CoA synthetase
MADETAGRSGASVYFGVLNAMLTNARDPLLAAFESVVRRGPEAWLVVSPERAWSRDQLARAARDLARRLEAEGFGEGDAVGLAAAPGPAFLAGYLALRRVGAVPVLCDSSRPTPDRLKALDRMGVAGFLAEATGWPESAAGWELDRRHPAHRLDADAAWGAIKLSSGSTGEPRGIAVGSEALLADDAQLASSMGLRAEDRLLAAVPFSHSYGFSSLLLPALVRGSTLVLAEDRAPLAPLTAGRELGATFFPTVPSWLGAWTRLATPPAWPDSLRLTIAAGAPLLPEVATAFRARTGRAVHVFYGASECGGICYDRAGDAAERGTVGEPVDGVALELDADGGRLIVRSRAVAERYLPEASDSLAGGCFASHDLAEIQGREIRLLGRLDDLILVRGKNVNPREVEAALVELAGVEEAHVLGVDGPDGPRTVLRVVVAAPDGGLDYRRVVEHCRRRLAEHKVPRSVVIVPELPRTERGKLDRKALAALAAIATVAPADLVAEAGDSPLLP